MFCKTCHSRSMNVNPLHYFIQGFLRTGDDAVVGNYGLLDQVGALTWIAQNIEEFGGDRNNVTLIGQGYGAAFVNFLMLSPVARGMHLHVFVKTIFTQGLSINCVCIKKNSC